MKKLIPNRAVKFLTCCFPALLLLISTSAFAQQASGTAANPAGLALVPIPREVHPQDIISLAHGASIVSLSRDAEDRFTANDLISRLADRGITVQRSEAGRVRLRLLRSDTREARELLARAHLTFNPAMQEQGYILLPEGDTLYDIAATSTGLYYGAQTMAQLITGRGADAMLHLAEVRDWPAMKYRGVSDDISRGPIPTLAFQKLQVRTFSQYKINIYSPYFENTLTYASNPLAAPPGGAMTQADVAALVKYAAQYHVTIIPEQESFGHLHHTLMFDTYSKLAETPQGSVLAPGQPGSLQLIHQWFTEIAEMFPGPFIHIGADETFDLGTGQTKAAVEQQGIGKVYIDFLLQIYKTLQPLHKRILFWGDIAMKDPALVKLLPKDMIAVAWEYNPKPEGYDKWIRPFLDAGLETWVAPAASNWTRMVPDNTAAFANIQRFTADGQRLGATGQLNTAWYDDGEGLFNQNWYGILFGAAAAWQPGMSSIPQFQNSYGQVFHGDESGKINQAELELNAAVQLLQQAGVGAGNDLFWMDPWSNDGRKASAKILPVVEQVRLHAEKAIILIEQVKAAAPLRHTDALDAVELGARRIDFTGYKFEAARNITQEYSQMLQEESNPAKRDDMWREFNIIFGLNGQCQDMRDGYGLLRDLYRNAWNQENRPYWLDNVLTNYDMAMQLWVQRSQQFHAAEEQFGDTGKLPEPQQLGMPELTH